MAGISRTLKVFVRRKSCCNLGINIASVRCPGACVVGCRWAVALLYDLDRHTRVQVADHPLAGPLSATNTHRQIVIAKRKNPWLCGISTCTSESDSPSL